MNLQKIQENIAGYKAFLQSDKKNDYLYLWESLQHFQDHWDISTLDFKTMYDNSLQNYQTRRLWHGDDFLPKDSMLQFIDFVPDMVEEMFRDLYNEQREIHGRMERFLHHCEALVKGYQEQHPHSKLNKHYHSYQVVSMYLAFQYPQNYCLYDFPMFQQVLQAIGARNIPKHDDVERYFKVMRTLYKFISKDLELMLLHQERLEGTNFYKGESLMMAYEYAVVMTSTFDV